MDKNERKNICKIVSGSYLYGTFSDASDKDYMGVFIPSLKEIVSRHGYKHEISENIKVSDTLKNTNEDVDFKLFSLARFFNLAGQGQPSQIEMLFAENKEVVYSTQEWKALVDNRDLFLSKNSIVPFLGFAVAQANKATLKIGHLENIRSIISSGEKLDKSDLNRPLSDSFEKGLFGGINRSFDNEVTLFEIAGRKFDANVSTGRFLEAVKNLEKKYGLRTLNSLADGVDWKSVHHAFRLIFEAEDLLTIGKIILPFEGERLSFLKDIKYKRKTELDWTYELNSEIEKIKQLKEKSNLKEFVDNVGLDELYYELLGI